MGILTVLRKRQGKLPSPAVTEDEEQGAWQVMQEKKIPTEKEAQYLVQSRV